MDQMGAETIIIRELVTTDSLPLTIKKMLGPKELLVITTIQMVTRVSPGKLPEIKVMEAPT